MSEISLTREVIDLLSLSKDPRSLERDEIKVKCPFCDNDKKYHMGISIEKSVYHCFRCGEKGGILDLYARIRLGRRSVKGEEAKEIYNQLLSDLGKKTAVFSYKPPKPIKALRDEELHKVYEAFLEESFLRLTTKHEENLLRRGLSREAIRRNAYRSISKQQLEVPKNPYYQKAIRVYEEKDIENLKMDHECVKAYSKRSLILGIMLSLPLVEKGFHLEGVPGFYILGDTPIFRYTFGILIPTRNEKGEIVSLQVRRDEGEPRYLTISSKGYPKGATEKISRIHVTLGERTEKVLITEGPLKGDVAKCLLEESGVKDVTFICLQGVNAVGGLKELLHYFKEEGVEKFYNALDMDRVLNANVLRALTKIKEIAKEEGILLHPLLWGEEYAYQRSEELFYKLYGEDTQVVRSEDPFMDLYDLGKTYREKGFDLEEYWEKKTKGIDDYLLSIRGSIRENGKPTL